MSELSSFKVQARFGVGRVVRHKFLDFRGVIYDVDPKFSNSEEWYQAIPRQFRPEKDQPFYHILAENDESFYTAYVSQQNLVTDATGPLSHPELECRFGDYNDGSYTLLESSIN